MPKKLTKTQRALMLDIIYDINNSTFPTYGDFLDQARQWIDWQDWMLQWPIWSVGENMSGYQLFLTERAARGFCRELEREPWREHYVTDMIPTTLQGIW